MLSAGGWFLPATPTCIQYVYKEHHPKKEKERKIWAPKDTRLVSFNLYKRGETGPMKLLQNVTLQRYSTRSPGPVCCFWRYSNWWTFVEQTKTALLQDAVQIHGILSLKTLVDICRRYQLRRYQAGIGRNRKKLVPAEIIFKVILHPYNIVPHHWDLMHRYDTRFRQ